MNRTQILRAAQEHERLATKLRQLSESEPSARLGNGKVREKIIEYFSSRDNAAATRRQIIEGTGIAIATVYQHCSKSNYLIAVVFDEGKNVLYKLKNGI